MADRDDRDLLGLTLRAPEGQRLVLAEDLVEQRERRRAVARVLGFTWLALMVVGLLGFAAAVQL